MRNKDSSVTKSSVLRVVSVILSQNVQQFHGSSAGKWEECRKLAILTTQFKVFMILFSRASSSRNWPIRRVSMTWTCVRDDILAVGTYCIVVPLFVYRTIKVGGRQWLSSMNTVRSCLQCCQVIFISLNLYSDMAFLYKQILTRRLFTEHFRHILKQFLDP